MPDLVAAIDCGTTSARFMVFDAKAAVVASHQVEFTQYYPQPSWHEHDPEEWVKTIDICAAETIKALEAKGLSRADVKAVGITNQRETTVVWDKLTGKPLHRAIAWPDTRNASTVRTLANKPASFAKSGVNVLREKTGLPLSTYFSGVKLRWLLDHVPAVKEAHDQDRLLFGTVDTYLLWHYTGGVSKGVFKTDVTNASRTMLMNLKTLDWDDELVSFFGFRKSCLAEISSNAERYGEFASGSPLERIPIAGMIGDQQAAMVGNQCLKPGQAKNTYGTGCFMLYNTGSEVVQSTHGLLTTTGYQLGKGGKCVYALEGSIAVAGSSIKWVRDNLGLIKESSEIGDLADSVKDTGGVYFVTGFSGLFAPYWDDTATGTLIGITGYTTKAHIARATLEATCFQTKAILDSMNKDSGVPLHDLKVDGGMTNSSVAMQLQADLLGIEVHRPEMRETTALGSALMAGHALDLFGWDLSNLDTLKEVNKSGQTIFESKITPEEREERYVGWNKAVERAKGWYERKAESD